MANEGYGQGPKKETVYSGPPIAPKQGTVYGGPPMQGGGTVYGGPTGGTVYNGPTGGTVYSGPTPGGAARQPTWRTNSSSLAGPAYGARVFYLIAGFTVFRSVLTYAGVQAATAGSTSPNNTAAILVGTLIVAGIFALLGFFTKRGSKIALVIGMLLYAADLILLLLGNPGSHAVSIGIHGLILFYLFRALSQFAD